VSFVSRRVYIDRPNQPLGFAEVELPPAPPRGAIVAIEYGGVCGSDVHVWRGARELTGPLVLGHEGIGFVAELGEGAETDYAGEPVAVGDRVYLAPQRPCHRCRACTVENEFAACEHRDEYFYTGPDEPSHATYNSHVWLVEGAPFYKVPDDVPPLALIAFGCALPTMLQANERAGRIGLGDTVLVQGAGPVGLAATVIARASGAERIVAVGGPAARLEMARRLGADETIDVDAHPDPAERAELVRQLLPRGADVVIEAAGVQSAFPEGLDLVARSGRFLVVGLHHGAGTSPIDPRQINRANVTVHGSALEQPGHQFKAIRFAARHHAQFPLADVVTHRFPLDRAEEALETMERGEAIKAVLEPNP
jgi:threonine dehydrogenase-like Zn-dependent dehydrogenase